MKVVFGDINLKPFTVMTRGNLHYKKRTFIGLNLEIFFLKTIFMENRFLKYSSCKITLSSGFLPNHLYEVERNFIILIISLFSMRVTCDNKIAIAAVYNSLHYGASLIWYTLFLILYFRTENCVMTIINFDRINIA